MSKQTLHPATAASLAAQTTPAAPSAPAAVASSAAANASVDDLARRLKASKTAGAAPAATAAAPAEQTAEPAASPEETVEETADANAEAETTEEATEPSAATPETDPEPGTEETTDDPSAEETTSTADSASTEVVDAVRALVAEAGGDPKAINKHIVQRFASLTAKRKAAEEQVRALSERLEQVQKSGPAPALSPAPFHPEIAKFDEQLAHAQQVIEWAAQNPDGAEMPDGKGGTLSYSAQQVKQFGAKAQAELTKLSAARETRMAKLQEEHVTKVKAAQDKAKAVYPWTKNDKSPEMVEAIALVREVPEIMLRPDWPLFVADAIEGRKAREAKAKAAPTKRPLGAPLPGKPAGSKVPPAVVTTPAAAAPRVDPKQRLVQQQQQQFRKTGSVEELTHLFAAKRAARNGAPATS